MMQGMRVLTINSLGDTEADNERVTLNSMEIIMTAAKDDVKQGRPAKKVSVAFKDGGQVDLFMSDFDLVQVEQAIGTYGFLEE